MCSSVSPFPLGRPVLATQLLVPSDFLQHPGLSWCTAWCPGPRAPRSQGPVPCGVPMPRAVPALSLWAWAVSGAFRVRETPQTPNSFSLFLHSLDFVSFNFYMQNAEKHEVKFWGLCAEHWTGQSQFRGHYKPVIFQVL